MIILYSLISLIFIKICTIKLKNKDPKFIVVDEHIGQAVSLIFCSQEIIQYLISFLLFRFFDIIKPFPINIIDRKMKNPFGVIYDDIVAGFFVCIIVYYGFRQ